MKKVVKDLVTAIVIVLIGEALSEIFFPLSLLVVIGHYMFVRAIIVAIGDKSVHEAARGAVKKAVVGAAAARDYVHAEMEAVKAEANVNNQADQIPSEETVTQEAK